MVFEDVLMRMVIAGVDEGLFEKLAAERMSCGKF